MLSRVEPVVAAVLGVAFLNEALGPIRIAGIALIVAAAVVLSRQGSVEMRDARAPGIGGTSLAHGVATRSNAPTLTQWKARQRTPHARSDPGVPAPRRPHQLVAACQAPQHRLPRIATKRARVRDGRGDVD